MKLYDNGIESTEGYPEEADEVSMTIEEYQEYKAACEDLVVKAKAAAKLVEDPNFTMIVMEEYFTKEPQRLGSLMASGRLDKRNFDGCVDDLRSIGHLRSFLQGFIEKGNVAVQELAELEKARIESLESTEAVS
jgi:hypothetical protein